MKSKYTSVKIRSLMTAIRAHIRIKASSSFHYIQCGKRMRAKLLTPATCLHFKHRLLAWDCSGMHVWGSLIELERGITVRSRGGFNVRVKFLAVNPLVYLWYSFPVKWDRGLQEWAIHSSRTSVQLLSRTLPSTNRANGISI